MAARAYLLLASLLVGACASLKTAPGSGEAPDGAAANDAGAEGSQGPTTGDGGVSSPYKSDAGNGDPRWPQWPLPADAPTADNFTVESVAGGTLVTDKTTGLTWQDARSKTALEWAQASAHCDDLEYGGVADWRLPTRIEAISIVSFSDTETSSQQAAKSGFAVGASGLECAWTASPYGGGTDHWRLHNGTIGTANGQACFARCVRGGPALGEPVESGYVRTSALVFDPRTGLYWERLPTPTGGSWDAANSRCSKLVLEGHAMRLPRIKELASIVDETRTGQAIDPMLVAPGLHSIQYTSNQHWRVDFYYGVLGSLDSAEVDARCVSGP